MSDDPSTSSLVTVVRRPTTSPPSSPTLPQLIPPPSAPVSHLAPRRGSSVETKRPRSPARIAQGRRFSLSQQTSAQVLRVFGSGILALKIASLCFNKDDL